MKISVVTVCLNAASTIRFTLDSFAAQTHPEKELLVIDGGSTDGTPDIARSYARDGVAVFSEPDEGIYDAMNKGLERVRGAAVGFLNADDRFAAPDCLSEIALALRDADIAFGHLVFVEDHERPSVVREWRASPYRPGGFRAGWAPPHPTFYLRREAAEAVGRFDRRFHLAADYDYMLRAFELHRFRSVLIDRVLVEMRHGGASTRGPGAYLRGNFEALRSRQLRLASGLVDRALVLKPLRKVAQFWPHARLAAGS